MNREDFFRALKGNDSVLVSRLDALRGGLNLEKLYLIYLNAEDAAWGVRHSAEIDRPAIIQKLREFIQEYTGEDYGLENHRLLIFSNDIEEVHYIAGKLLKDAGYRGTLEVLYADDTKGEILLTVDSFYQSGLRNALRHLLPWVKKVDFTEEQAIIVTERAARKIWSVLQEQNVAVSGGLRFRLGSGGCSGFQYVYAAESEPQADDEVVEAHFRDGETERTVRVFIDQTSLPFLKGTVLDYGPLEDRGFAEDFIVQNPNAHGGCGCGKSISF